MSRLHRRLLSVVLTAVLLSVLPGLRAATINKADNTNALNLASSWATTAPGPADVGTWTSAVTGANSTVLGADLAWRGIAIASPGGAVTIDGGDTLTLGQSGIDLSVATQNLTVHANLKLGVGQQTWNVASIRTLAVDGTVSRDPGAVLNVRGAGTTTSASLANAGTTGILGPWAYALNGTVLNYATASGGSLVPYTGGTAVTAMNQISDTTGTVNYDIGAGVAGAFVGTPEVNTLRLSQVGGNYNYSGSLEVNGIMSAQSTGGFYFNGTTTIGANQELVVINSGRAMAFNGSLLENPAPGSSSLVLVGSGNLTLGGANTFAGEVIVNHLGSTPLTIAHSGALAGGGDLRILGISGNSPLFFAPADAATGDYSANDIRLDLTGSPGSSIFAPQSSLASKTIIVGDISGTAGSAYVDPRAFNGSTLVFSNGIAATNVGSYRVGQGAHANGTYEFGGGLTGTTYLQFGYSAGNNILFSVPVTQVNGMYAEADNGSTFGVTHANGTSTFASQLTLRGTVNAAQSLNLASQQSGGKLTFSGLITESSGSHGLRINADYTRYGATTETVTNAGTVEFSRAAGNNYTGATTVYGGTLLVSNTSGSATGTGAVVVNSGGTLGGTGIIAPGGTAGITANSGGSVAPGASIGTLRLNGGNTTGTVLTMADGANFVFEIAEDGSAADQIEFWNYITGDLALDNTTIELELLGVPISGLRTYTVTLFEFFSNNGTTPIASDIDTGLILGNLDPRIYSASLVYNANSIALLYSVPEPASAALLALAGLALLKRRR